jgi:ABC-type sugar transport system substrate-binding protein
MKILSKKFFTVILLAVAATTLAPFPLFAAGSDTAGKTGQRYKFVVITHATAVPFFVPVRKGAEEAGKMVGDQRHQGRAG